MIWKKSSISFNDGDVNFNIEGPSATSNNSEEDINDSGINLLFDNGYLLLSENYKKFYSLDLTLDDVRELRDALDDFLGEYGL